LWRKDDTFETVFNLTNPSSTIFHRQDFTGKSKFVLFDADGNVFLEEDISVLPNEVKKIYLNDLTKKASTDYGGFSVFHTIFDYQEFYDNFSWITERGYISYRKKGESIWKHMHGNLDSLAYDFGSKQKNVYSIHSSSIHNQVYSPQLLFSDCSNFDLFLLNPTPRIQKVSLFLFDNQNVVKNEIVRNVAPFGGSIFSLENTASQACSKIELRSKVIFWRPIIFKYYADSFDVLHS